MPRPHIPAKLRRLVINRAGGRCEYCLLHQDDRPETHPIDHVIALKHGGRTVKENLALACVICNGNKGSDLATIDPAPISFGLFQPCREQMSKQPGLFGCLGNINMSKTESVDEFIKHFPGADRDNVLTQRIDSYRIARLLIITVTLQ